MTPLTDDVGRCNVDLSAMEIDAYTSARALLRAGDTKGLAMPIVMHGVVNMLFVLAVIQNI